MTISATESLRHDLGRTYEAGRRMLRFMPVIGCCRIRASSDGVKFPLWLFIPAHALVRLGLRHRR